FSATDLEVGITTTVIGKVEAEGKITLPAKLLLDFVSNNKDESIELTLSDTIAHLKSERYQATIHGISADEFPTIPPASKDYSLTLPKDSLLDAMKKVNISAAIDDTRPVLSGVYLNFSNKELYLVATDSYRLSEKKITLAEPTLERTMIVPTRTMNEVLRIAAAGNSLESITLSASESQVAFMMGDTLIVSRLIEGSFPNYKSIIPTSFKTELAIATGDLLGAVKMSSLFARGQNSNNIKFQVKDGKVVLASTVSEAGSTQSNISATVTGEDVEVSFNARYVLDILNVIGEDEVLVKLNDSSSAGVVTGKKDEYFVYIIMPLKVEGV
ncbi:MAG TPA: DNA polymerase III subunit beta, partial [bacterium]|nr:DNA polymerase III subunit beta [bacterium]